MKFVYYADKTPFRLHKSDRICLQRSKLISRSKRSDFVGFCFPTLTALTSLMFPVTVS